MCDKKDSINCLFPIFQHDCQEFLALLLDTLHEQLNSKGELKHQNTEPIPSISKQPISNEHIINNRVSMESLKTELSTADDRSMNATSTHSSLTFDNMKDSKSSLGSDLKTCVDIKPANIADGLKPTLDRCKHPNLIGFTVNQISEDSNHSSISEHSSDSDQCSVMKNLKLRSSPIGSQSSPSLESKIASDNAEKDCRTSSLCDDSAETEVSKAECRPESFKGVRSLQDFRQKCEAEIIPKASSDLDLASMCAENVTIKIGGDFEALEKESSAVCESDDVTDVDYTEANSGIEPSSCTEPVLLNNAISAAVTGVPSLQDLYAKESKTLNTNVLATEFLNATVATDSKKFAKHDNTSEMIVASDTEDILQSVGDVLSKPDGLEPKRIKDVNIRADKKSKFPKGGSCSMMNVEKEECFALSSVKRMKFEGTEKNLQMQEICKIQKEALLCEALKTSKPGNNDELVLSKEETTSVESDIDSDLVEDIDQEADMDVSDDDADDTCMVSHGCRAPEEVLYTSSEVLAAEQAWQEYHSKNDSVIVDTFQGQFKSTVSYLSFI